MPGTMRSETLLPSIKCSNCGDQIDIANMANHICTSTTSDPAAANRSFIQMDQSTPQSSYSESPGGLRSFSPITPGSQRKFPRPMYGDSARYKPSRPPSPELTSNLDCAFPPFPNNRNPQQRSPERNAKPTPLTLRQPSVNPDHLAPLSPRLNGGMSVMKRMDTIAPGPFGSKTGKEEEKPQAPSEPNSGHRRNATLGSTKHAHRTSTSSVQSFLTRSSTTKSEKSGTSVLSNHLDDAPQPLVWRSSSFPTKPFDGNSDSNNVSNPNNLHRPQPPPRSQTFPLQQSGESEKASSIPPRPRRPSELSNNPYRPFQAIMPEGNDDPALQGMQPQTAPNGSYRQPSGSNGPQAPRAASRNGIRMDPRLENAPPVPPAPASHDRLKYGHSTSDSSSSDGLSSTSDSRSQSSRSSPPGSEPDGWSRRPSKDDSYNPYSGSNVGSQDPPLRFGKQTGMDRPNVPRPLNTTPPAEDLPSPCLESPMDPAIQPGLGTRNFGYQSRNASPSATGRNPSVSRNSSTISNGRTLKRRPTNKGDCRGCGAPIFGKCVKAADGRLTGRYHRECFTCRTCTQPFTDGSFYVLEDHPYCGFHYHKLNNSLCVACNSGIEGLYLSTDERTKFHPGCFTCTRCHVALKDDYFEVAGSAYCEPHAFAAVNRGGRPGGGFTAGPSVLGPGVKAQRRTTKLMMI
ncbi:hypothetical protein P152DRAFT_447440 [Eremomyces bilateralis CBS 781.70]|uniref:LIM zinc-binding domain-containing protein n=1 Tax=Eremomyces bilateralis CBS 781.70 TaxID=1392243 RepID=A0A6G1GAS5_9PEZI|nr:uncharacterized protein P152DRAFT_447440 [Eremomyces bilateralis CBS 781.70]KAF1815197.1 hypothetical protein P152DRAFT_447440 [Eremomyces bilateralis CBS 781.70]